MVRRPFTAAWAVLARNKDELAALQSLVSSAALFIAALWVLFLFDPLSQVTPDLGVTQKIASSRLAGGVIVLEIDDTLADTTKTSARIRCTMVEVQRLRPSSEQNLNDVQAKLWAPYENASIALPLVKLLQFDNQSVVVPASESTHVSSVVFIPEAVAPAQPEAVKSLVVRTKFFSHLGCKSDDRHWDIVTTYDVPAAGSPAADAVQSQQSPNSGTARLPEPSGR